MGVTEGTVKSTLADAGAGQVFRPAPARVRIAGSGAAAFVDLVDEVDDLVVCFLDVVEADFESFHELVLVFRLRVGDTSFDLVEFLFEFLDTVLEFGDVCEGTVAVLVLGGRRGRRCRRRGGLSLCTRDPRTSSHREARDRATCNDSSNMHESWVLLAVPTDCSSGASNRSVIYRPRHDQDNVKADRPPFAEAVAGGLVRKPPTALLTDT